jgi:AcrR family transcriptional regulator
MDDQAKSGRGTKQPAASVRGESEPLPLENPGTRLHPTALKILQAAEDTVLDLGLSRLTLDEVVARSGENRALIRYHFGNKAGLIEALVQSVMYQTTVARVDEVNAGTGEEQLHLFVEGLNRVLERRDFFTLYNELMPYVLRDSELRNRVGKTYQTYWGINSEWMGLSGAEDEDTARALAILSVAIFDGLSIQMALDPQGFDLPRVLSLLEGLLRDAVDNLVPPS